MRRTPIDSREYGRLCAEVIPKVIETDDEFDRMIAKMEELDFKETRSREEEILLTLLERLIKDYDDKVQLPRVEPYKVVLHLMAHKGLRQADLLPVFVFRSVASDVLSGKRQLTKAHIRKLSEFFSISHEAFISNGA